MMLPNNLGSKSDLDWRAEDAEGCSWEFKVESLYFTVCLFLMEAYKKTLSYISCPNPIIIIIIIKCY